MNKNTSQNKDLVTDCKNYNSGKENINSLSLGLLLIRMSIGAVVACFAIKKLLIFPLWFCPSTSHCFLSGYSLISLVSILTFLISAIYMSGIRFHFFSFLLTIIVSFKLFFIFIYFGISTYTYSSLLLLMATFGTMLTGPGKYILKTERCKDIT